MDNETRIKLERAIVLALIRHLKAAGFAVFRVNDGEEFTYPKNDKETLAAVFSVDDSSLRFVPADLHGQREASRSGATDDKSRALEACKAAEHGVLLIGGNGEDIISDWNYYKDDRDGFSAAMDSFSPEIVVTA